MFNYQIQEFFGIQQQADGALLPPGSAADCRNMTTLDGNLSVAAGYVRHIASPFPGDEKVLKLIVARAEQPKFYVVTAAAIYAHGTDWAWRTIHSFAEPLFSEQVDYMQTQIAEDDCIVVATGSGQMLKIRLTDDEVEPFGTGATSFEGTVTAYDADTRTVTLSAELSATALRHAPIDGITIGELWYDVESAQGNAVVLGTVQETAPVVGAAASIRGGGSDAPCNFVGLYYGRLFAAGDPNAPCRLYWSAVPGDGRTVEDWLSVDGSADASGGFVEVGDAPGDAIVGLVVLDTQILIFKRYSAYRFYGNRPANFTLERVENHSEWMSNASAVVKYNIPYWFTASGMKYYDGTGILPAHDGVRFLHRFLQSGVSTRTSRGVHCDNVLYFTCKQNPEAVYDDTVIVYDIVRQSYTIRDGFGVADIAQHDGHIYLVNANRYVYEFNEGDDYDGAPIYAYWETQHTDLGSKLYKKQITDVLLRGSGGDFVLSVTAGGVTQKEPRRWVATAEGEVLDVQVRIDLANSFHLRLENRAGSRFRVNGGLDVLFGKEMKVR